MTTLFDVNSDQNFYISVQRWWGHVTECDRSQIKKFFEIANSIDPLLKFTFIISDIEVTYLDTEIYKGDRFKTNSILDIRSHVKTTETYQYSQTCSCHPSHTFKNISTTETIRHIRNNSCKNQLEIHAKTLEDKLVARGYKRLKTRENIQNITRNTDRRNVLSYKR